MAPRFWRRHRGTALHSLLLLTLLHRLNCLAFLVACAPVLLLTAFLLRVVLFHSDVAQLSASTEDEVDHYLYKKIHRHRRHIIISSSEDESPSPSSEQDDEEEEHLVAEQEDIIAVFAWTADDERSIQSIGLLEQERNARLEKLVMLSRSSLQQRNIRIPGGSYSYDYDKDDPGSGPLVPPAALTPFLPRYY